MTQIARSTKKRWLTLLPRKRVHSLSVELLNAFVCICPGSRNLGENRIALERIPAHEPTDTLATAGRKRKKKKVRRRSGIHLTISSSHCGPEESSPLTWSKKKEKIIRKKSGTSPQSSALCGAQRTASFYPRWRRAKNVILSWKAHTHKIIIIK